MYIFHDSECTLLHPICSSFTLHLSTSLLSSISLSISLHLPRSSARCRKALTLTRSVNKVAADSGVSWQPALRVLLAREREREGGREAAGLSWWRAPERCWGCHSDGTAPRATYMWDSAPPYPPPPPFGPLLPSELQTCTPGPTAGGGWVCVHLQHRQTHWVNMVPPAPQTGFDQNRASAASLPSTVQLCNESLTIAGIKVPAVSFFFGQLNKTGTMNVSFLEHCCQDTNSWLS